jgi:hypothetical protein
MALLAIKTVEAEAIETLESKLQAQCRRLSVLRSPTTPYTFLSLDEQKTLYWANAIPPYNFDNCNVTFRRNKNDIISISWPYILTKAGQLWQFDEAAILNPLESYFSVHNTAFGLVTDKRVTALNDSTIFFEDGTTWYHAYQPIAIGREQYQRINLTTIRNYVPNLLKVVPADDMFYIALNLDQQVYLPAYGTNEGYYVAWKDEKFNDIAVTETPFGKLINVMVGTHLRLYCNSFVAESYASDSHFKGRVGTRLTLNRNIIMIKMSDSNILVYRWHISLTGKISAEMVCELEAKFTFRLLAMGGVELLTDLPAAKFGIEKLDKQNTVIHFNFIEDVKKAGLYRAIVMLITDKYNYLFTRYRYGFTDFWRVCCGSAKDIKDYVVASTAETELYAAKHGWKSDETPLAIMSYTATEDMFDSLLDFPLSSTPDEPTSSWLVEDLGRDHDVEMADWRPLSGALMAD